MAKVAPFEIHTDRYERWFVHHEAVYYSELLAVRKLLPHEGLGLEIGVGTGRFAFPLGIAIGVDPSLHMLSRAHERGIRVVGGTAEALPFADAAFDHALIVTTICFVDDAIAMLEEARRVLKPGGTLVIGFVDRDSTLGQNYLAHQAENVFYREAVFYSAREVRDLLGRTGFGDLVWIQTLFKSPDETTEIEPIRSGFGEGAFVVIRAKRS